MAMTTCLWFDDQAEEAARFYVSVFRDGKVGDTVRYGESASEAATRPVGSVMTVEFEVEGQKFMALNGGPLFTFSEAISFVVERDTQAELDELWQQLTENGGAESQCGWLKDKFGVSWQVVPSGLPDLLTSESAVAALMQMRKIDIAALERARDREPSLH
jgi:predicted 3-demethylubiquinone-9 3-methyltransferase (glyoxalase superfamily)